MLVATVMSAQTTDEQVNKVTPVLFERWPEASDLAAADPEEVEQVIFSTGFYRQKTKSIQALSADLDERFGGVVPGDLDALVTLRGVGRKTASVVLAEAFGVPAIAVDTHVNRVSQPARSGGGEGPHQDRVRPEGAPSRDGSGAASRCATSSSAGTSAMPRQPRCWECPLRDRCGYPDKTPPP